MHLTIAAQKTSKGALELPTETKSNKQTKAIMNKHATKTSDVAQFMLLKLEENVITSIGVTDLIWINLINSYVKCTYDFGPDRLFP